jgi:hypothetical protein
MSSRSGLDVADGEPITQSVAAGGTGLLLVVGAGARVVVRIVI